MSISLSWNCPVDGAGPCWNVLDEDRHVFSSIKGLPDAAGLKWTCLDGLNAAIRHVHDIDVGHALEQFAGEVIGRTVAGRGEIEFARLFLRQRDQLLHAVRRHARVDNQHDGCRRKQRDWSEVLGWIEGKLAVEGLVDG